jgi:PAS domain S-box-containing protein
MASPSDLGQTLLADSPDALIALTAEGRVLYWSVGATALYGHAAQDAVGHDVETLAIPADQAAKERLMLREALETGFAAYDSQRRMRDGSLRGVEVVRRAVRDVDGTFRFVVSIEKLSRSAVNT